MHKTPLILENHPFRPLRTHQERLLSLDGGIQPEKRLDRNVSLIWSSFSVGEKVQGIRKNYFLNLDWVVPTLNRNRVIKQRVFSTTKNHIKLLRRILSLYLFHPFHPKIEELLFRLVVEIDDTMISTWLKYKSINKNLRLAQINSLFRMVGIRRLDLREYHSTKNLRIFIEEENSFLDFSIKYSGWKRHQNDKGSLSIEPPIDPFPLLINEKISKFEEKQFFESLLSVGGIPTEKDISSLKMALIRAETERYFKYLKEEL